MCIWYNFQYSSHLLLDRKASHSIKILARLFTSIPSTLIHDANTLLHFVHLHFNTIVFLMCEVIWPGNRTAALRSFDYQ